MPTKASTTSTTKPTDVVPTEPTMTEPTPAEAPPPATSRSLTPRRRTPKRPVNPYTLKKSSKTMNEDWRLDGFDEFMTFITTINDYINIISTHKDCSMEAWHLLWTDWLADDIMTASNLHMIAITVDFPENAEQHHKSVAEHILKQLPILNGHLIIPKRTRDLDPLCYHNSPVVTSLPDALDNNPFQLLASDDDDLSLADLGQIDELADSDIDDSSKDNVHQTDNSPTASVDTATLINEMTYINEVVDKNISDIISTVSKDDSKISVTEPGTSLLRKSDVHQYMMEHLNRVNKENAAYLKVTVNNELGRLQKLFESATAKATAATTSQQTLFEDITKNAIEKYSDKCSNHQNSLDEHADNLIKMLPSKISDASTAALTKHNNNWKTLDVKMKATYTQLVNTNKIAVKNNTILKKKLSSTITELRTLEDKIAIQKATISNLESTLNTIDTRFSTVTKTLRPNYLDTIDKQAKVNIAKLVDERCKHPEVFDILTSNITSKSEAKLEKLHDEKIKFFTTQSDDIESYIMTKATQIKNDTCTYMQDKANSAMATIDKTVNISVQDTDTSTNIPRSMDEDNTPKTPGTPHQSKLFPNVNPNDIGSYSRNTDQNTKDFWERPELPHENNLRDNEYIYTKPDSGPKLVSVNVNTFYKIKWNTKCTKEMDIFHFYESLQHMASTCGIPMRDLNDINENQGVCPLNSENCTNYSQIYKFMKGAIFHKINDKNLWDGYNHGWNLVQANLSNCDGFEVMNDILAEILPTLNMNTPKGTKIPLPHYANMPEDNIYTYILSYNAFLKFEELGPSKRTYSPYEVAVTILTDLENDIHNRFDKGIDYVRNQLHRSPDGYTVSRDITIGKIAKTICKYSPLYKVGEYKTDIMPTIRTMNYTPRNPTKQNYTPRNSTKNDSIIKCKICGQRGHDQNSENGCMVFAKWIMCQQASTRLSESDIKTNTKKFLKKIRQRDNDTRQRHNIQRKINALQDREVTEEHTALIHALQILQTEGYDSQDESSSDESE